MQARQNSAPARKLGKIKSNIREMLNTNQEEEEVCEGGDECTNGADECKEEEEFKLINSNQMEQRSFSSAATGILAWPLPKNKP